MSFGPAIREFWLHDEFASVERSATCRPAGIDIGRTATLSHIVTDAPGSGDLSVVATLRLLAWCEAATRRAVQDELAPG